MTRLLIVTTKDVTLRSFLLPYAKYFRSRGWRVDALANGVSSCSVCRDSFDYTYEISWERNPLSLKNLTNAPRLIRNIVHEGRYDLVHVHTPIAAFVTRFALRNKSLNRKPKVIYTAHGFHFHPAGSFFANKTFLALERVAAPWTDHLIVISKTDYNASFDYKIQPAERITLMPGIGIDLTMYNPSLVDQSQISSFRNKIGLNLNDNLFVMVAEYTPNKCHEIALQALAKLKSNAHIAFAGTGPRLSEMRALAAKLEISGKTHFLGFYNDIPTLFSSALATLLISRREGLPRSLMESLALETPAIGTNIRGIRDLLENGTGCIIPVGDVDALTNALEWFIRNQDRAILMGRHGRKKMADYAIERLISQHEEVYSKLLIS